MASNPRTSSFTLTLTPTQQSDRFTLTSSTMSYSISLRPEMDVVFNDLLRRLSPVLVGGRDPSGQLAPYELLRAVGGWLWQALFPNTAPREQREALQRELQTGTTPLLLALPSNLATLPWELLCNPAQSTDAGFLARRRPLVRLTPGLVDLPPVAPPVRVLLLISSPPMLEELRHVDIETERAAVESATRELRETGLLHLMVEDIVTPRRVQQALLRFKPHILHYVGHGSYEKDVGGYLVWEDEKGEPLALPADRLADLLRSRDIRAVLLHGCETARSDAHTDFRSLAGVLLEAGMPAVLAQQAGFTYESSQRASEMFYTALTSGSGLAEATFEARQALAQADRPDWAVPVLQSTMGGLKPLLDVDVSPGVPDPLLQRRGASTDLPAPTGTFIGRQRELRALRVMLESTSGMGAVMALITGPGGVGKSTLAAQAVMRYGGRYKAGLTLNCLEYRGIDLFLQRVGEFLRRQGASQFSTEILPDSKLGTAAKIEAAIEELNRAGPFLLIIDNFESVQLPDRTIADPDLLLLLQKLLTNLQRGRVLITGRYAVEGLLPDGKFAANILPLGLSDLNRYEIRRLLARHHLLDQLSETVRDELIREFGGLPYIYDLLSSKAANQNLADLIHDVQGRITRERQQRAKSEWQQVRQQVIEFTALQSSVERLPERSRALLAQLSLFRRPFPQEAMERGLGETSPTWQSLIDWALLRYNAVDDTYHLHNLTAQYAQRLLGAAERKATQVRVAEWYIQYGQEVSQDLADYLEAYQLLRNAGEVQEAGKLANQFGEFLGRLGLYQLWHNLCKATISDTEGFIAGEASRQLGLIAYLQRDFAEAHKWYGRALAAFEQLNHQMGRAATLHQLGSVAALQGRDVEARRLYNEALAISREEGDLHYQAAALNQLGILAQHEGKYDEALQLCSEALPLIEQLGDKRGRASVLHQMGEIADHKGRYDEARRLFSEELAISRELGDLNSCIIALSALGSIVERQGQNDEAHRLLSEALSISEQLGKPDNRASVLKQLGDLAEAQGQYDEALSLYDQALKIFEQLDNPDEYRDVLESLGGVALYQRRLDEAHRLYSEALAISERLERLAGQATALHQLGNIALVREQHHEAERLLNRALTIYEQRGDLSGRARVFHDLGNNACIQKQFGEAQRLYSEALTIFRQLGDQRRSAATLFQLGMNAQEQRQYEEAEHFYVEALRISQQLGDLYQYASTSYKLGELMQQQGDSKAALAHMAQAQEIFVRLKLPQHQVVLHTIAELRAEVGETMFAALWQEVSDGRSLPDLPAINDRRTLQLRLFAFIENRTLSESRDFVERHPDLLGMEADALLDEMEQVAVAHQQKAALRRIKRYRALLARCREVGIVAAFVEQEKKQEPSEEAHQRHREEPPATISPGELVAQASALYQLGTEAEKQEQHDQARQLYNKALVYFEQLDDSRGRAYMLIRLASIAERQEHYEEAHRLYGEALPLLKQAQDLPGYAGTLSLLGHLVREQQRYDEARQWWSEALALFKQLEEHAMVASTLDLLGELAQQRERYDEADRWYREALPVFEQLGNRPGCASTMRQLGRIAFFQRRLDVATHWCSNALPIFEELGDTRNRTSMLSLLGHIAHEQEQYDEAHRWYSEALPLFEQVDMPEEYVLTLHQLGHTALQQEQYDRAYQFYSKALPLFEQLGDLPGRATTLHQLGRIAQQQNRYDTARELYNDALMAFERAGDLKGRANTLGQLGLLARQQGDYTAALRYTIQALKIFERLHSPQLRIPLLFLTEVRKELGEAAFTSLWQRVSDGLPLPNLPADLDRGK